MLFCARRIRALFGFLCLLSAAAFCLAQQTTSTQTIRYHFGDDPRWADPAFDDSSWPVAHDGQIPGPTLFSDGFVWVRLRVPVPPGISDPLAIRQVNPSGAPGAEELYVNGRLVGHDGRVPPHPLVLVSLKQTVFPLATGSLAPGTPAAVALRGWILPALRTVGAPLDARFEIDRQNILTTASREHVASLLLPQLPQVALAANLVLVGVGLLLLWRLTRARDLVLFAFILICAPTFTILFALTDVGLLPIPIRLWSLIVGVPQCAGPVLQFVFIWSALQLPPRKWKYVFIALSILSTCGAVLGSWLSTATPLVFGLMGVSAIGAVIRDAGMCAFLVWAIFRRPSNRLLAFLLLLPPLFSLLGIIGDVTGLSWLSFRSFQFFQITLLIALYAIAALLARRGWKSWLANNELRVEMQAAREVQQQLVPAALPAIAGFKADAAYLPAAEVGGDFYQILMQPDDTTLIVVGDVSGKGQRHTSHRSRNILSRRTAQAPQSRTSSRARRRLNHLHLRPHLKQRRPRPRQRRPSSPLPQRRRTRDQQRPPPRPHQPKRLHRDTTPAQPRRQPHIPFRWRHRSAQLHRRALRLRTHKCHQHPISPQHRHRRPAIRPGRRHHRPHPDLHPNMN